MQGASLAGGKHNAAERFEAGQRYARIFAACESSVAATRPS